MTGDRPVIPSLPEFLRPAISWSWRGSFDPPGGPPESGTALGERLEVHHDGSARDLTLDATGDRSGLLIRSRGFSGSYVSISADIPAGQAGAMTRSSIFGAVAEFAPPWPDAGWWRLNLRASASRFQPDGVKRWQGDWLVSEFDLSELSVPEFDGGWVDLLLPPVPGGQMGLRGLWLYHRPLAGF